MHSMCMQPQDKDAYISGTHGPTVESMTESAASQKFLKQNTIEAQAQAEMEAQIAQQQQHANAMQAQMYGQSLLIGDINR